VRRDASLQAADQRVYRTADQRGGHPGGPFWKNEDEGAWSIPKGLIAPGEASLIAAKREFAEETGYMSRWDFFLWERRSRRGQGRLRLGRGKRPGREGFPNQQL
jgi:predicted NUDIX family NTP pyrophosphohydrolase